MKVRTITLSIEVQPDDFVEKNGVYPIGLKLEEAKRSLDRIATSLRAASYDVQTLRVAFNSLEEWLVAGTREAAYYVTVVQILVKHLIAHSIDFCSIGCCSTLEALGLVPALLAVSDRLYCSALFKKSAEHDIAPDLSLIRQAAKSMLAVSEASGVLGCFRFCASFNCAGGTPFFPAAYFDGDKNETNDQSPDKLTKNKNGSLVSIGLECGDLLFIGFHGAECASQGTASMTLGVTYELSLWESNFMTLLFAAQQDRTEQKRTDVSSSPVYSCRYLTPSQPFINHLFHGRQSISF